MVNLQLDDSEADVLRMFLEDGLGELRMEVSHTDNADFREELKHREVILKRLIAKVGGAVA